MKRTMKNLTALSVLSLMVSLTWAGAQRSSDTMKPHSMTAASRKGVPAVDKMFAMKAARGGIAEVQAGKLAAAKATKDEWKQYGQKMVDDHGAANEKLKAIASSKGIALPASPSAKDAATIAKLRRLNGAAFDSAYAKFAHASHIEAEQVFTKEVNAGKDADLKQFAAETLPTVKEHHKMAMDIAPQAHPKSKMSR